MVPSESIQVTHELVSHEKKFFCIFFCLLIQKQINIPFNHILIQPRKGLVRSASSKANDMSSTNIINEGESSNYANLDTQIANDDVRLPAWASAIVFAPPASI